MITPDPALLQTFIAVVETGSFTGAANRVHRTQAAVSMQIRRLEETVGSTLIDRSVRRARLTAKGELFYDHARRIIHSYEDAMNAFNGQESAGEITIGTTDDIAASYLPEVISRCLTEHPSLHIKVFCEPSRRLHTLLAEGHLDLAIVTEGEGPASGTLLSREAPVWACSQLSDVYKRENVPVAIFHTGDVFRRRAIERLESTGKRARIVVSSPSFSGVRAALLSHQVVAVLFLRNVSPVWRVLTRKDGFPPLPKIGTQLVRGTTRDKRHQIVNDVADLIKTVWADL